MALTAKFLISALASLTVVGAVVGVVYTLDSNSVSEEEVHKMTGIDNKLVERKICNKLESTQRDKWPEICKNAGNLNIRGELENDQPRKKIVSEKIDGNDLSSPPSILQIKDFGEDALKDFKSKVGI